MLHLLTFAFIKCNIHQLLIFPTDAYRNKSVAFIYEFISQFNDFLSNRFNGYECGTNIHPRCIYPRDIRLLWKRITVTDATLPMAGIPSQTMATAGTRCIYDTNCFTLCTAGQACYKIDYSVTTRVTPPNNLTCFCTGRLVNSWAWRAWRKIDEHDVYDGMHYGLYGKLMCIT